MSKKYFYNINGIRFLLASLVLIHHVAVVTQLNGISNFFNKLDFLKAFGPVSVSLFFALSGFLITYILLIEKKETGSISIKKFYLSRVLRIFPLYYIIITIHLFVIPYTPLHTIESKLLVGDIGIHFSDYQLIPTWLINILYFLLMPQVALSLLVANGAKFIPAGHVWSIGVEEIFYLIWPLLLLRYSNKFRQLVTKLLLSYYSLIILFAIAIILIKYNIVANKNFQISLNFSCIMFLYNRVTCMFIGAVGAYILINKPAILQRITQKNKFILSIVIMILLFATGIRVPFLTHEFYCLFFVTIILYLIKEDKKYFLENPVLNYLGKISYGIYMYQMLAIFLVTYLYKQYNFHFIIIYPLSFIVTILMASFSYELIESKFLKLKNK